MAIPQHLLDEQLDRVMEEARPKRGEEIFAGTDYPRTWDGFIGQVRAKQQLAVMVGSANARGVRVEHTLLASGLHGIGKTTLATMLAGQAEIGILHTTGPLTALEAREMMRGMQDHDILFIDEAHLLVSGNRTKADWLLPYMTEGKLYTERGAETMPDVAIVAATTDVGKLPETLISRFMCTPDLYPYTAEEGAQITGNLAERMHVEIAPEHWPAVARAADNNPRLMRKILTQVRDLAYAYPDGHPNLEIAFDWAGVSADGLSTIAREVLLLLLIAEDHTSSLDSLRAHLNEPGPIRHHEQQLLQRHLLTITGRGRRLTDTGVARARQEAERLR